MRAEPGAGGVVRVGDKHHSSVLVDGVEHAVQIMAIVDGRNHAAFCAHRLGAKRVCSKGMRTEHRIATRCEPAAGDQIDDVVGAVAQGDLICLQAETLGQLGLESVAAAIGITGQVGKLTANSLEHPRIGPQRVFVAGQFDDLRRLDTQLTRQFIDRFASDVRGQFLYARHGQGDEISTHVQLRRSRTLEAGA